MANLSNINNNFIVTDVGTGQAIVGATNAVSGVTLTVGGSAYLGPIGTTDASTIPEMQTNAVLTLKPHDTNSTNMVFSRLTGGATMGVQTTNGPGTAAWHIALSPFLGNVGIGTGDTAPSRKLDVRDTSNSQATILAYNKGASFTGTVYEAITDRTASSAFNLMNLKSSTVSKFLVRGDGNVGIGTDAPGRELTVEGAGNVYIRIQSRTDNDSTALELQNTQHVWTIANDDTNNDALEFRSGGVGTLMVIEKAGNVGIGTTSPTVKLDVASTNFGLPGTSGTTPVGFQRWGYTDRTWGGNEVLMGIINGGNYPAYIQCKVPTNYAQNRDLALNPQGGNVGIGTTSPAYKLVVEDSASDIFYGATDATSGSMFRLRSNNKAVTIFNTNADGDTGIGINGYTNAKLGVYGNLALLNGSQINLTGTLDSDKLWYGMRFDNNEVQIYTYNASNRSITFNTVFGGTGIVDQLMKIEAGGNVGIGTTSPDSLLHLASSFPEIRLEDSAYATNHYSSIDGNGGSGFLTLSADSSNTAANSAMIFKVDATERMRITSAGVIGIGDLNPTLATRLVIAGSSGSGNVCDIRTGTTANTNVGAIVFRNSASAYCGQITVNGATAVTSYLSASDYRLKEDLKDFKGLDLVSNIKVYNYKWKSADERTYGVVAHELQEVLPQAVDGNKDDEQMQGVDYSKIVPLLVKSIQELKADNDSLKARIETLENN